MTVNEDIYLSKNKQIEGQLDFFSFIENLDNSSKEKTESEILTFSECELCWCRDCKHNEVNEAVPRDFGGEMKPCPACGFCIENDEPEICEIGSYKNGCKLRAMEEGISEDGNV